ncbi:MAG: ATP-dependent DNA helicase [Archaeoglobus sp.]|nr:ATP-dependent DNA helicase [Archaeoglobus sp.]
MVTTRATARFPYPYREGQEEAIKFISESDKNVCLDAPTGFGKTAVILSALLNKSYPIIWAVRTGNEADRPVEELKEINKKTKKKFFGFSFRGKRDMCLAARQRGLTDTDSVAYFCKSFKAKCPYFENLSYYRINPTRPLLYSEIIEICSEAEVCPYYLQRELLYHADLVALSYNYIIHPGMSWVIRSIIPFKACFLVVDEAHNLRVVGNINSDQITLSTFKNAIKELNLLEENELAEIVTEMQEIALKIHKNMQKAKEEERTIDLGIFIESGFNKGNKELREYLAELRKVGEFVRRRRLEEEKAPRSSAYHLASFFLDSLEFLGKDGVAFIATAEPKNLIIERWDMRSAEILRDVWRQFRKCVFCSGTLKPINAFAETIGLEEWEGRVFRAELGESKCLIIRGLSTRGEELSKEEAEKYARLIESFMEIDANLAIFSASYRIQTDLLPKIRKTAKKMSRKIYVEKQGMQGDAARKLLDDFKRDGGILVAPMTGRFAEGADFPGKELEGVFLVGIPFDRMSLRSKLYIDYYRRLYGEEKGWYYSYVIPALHRASQALGRALRSKEDKALFVLGDERYREKLYARLLPSFLRPEIVDFSDARRRILEAWEELKD